MATGSSSDGTKAVQFNYSQLTPNGVLIQTFGTIPGDTYTLSFDAGAFSLANQNEQRLAVTLVGNGNLLNQTISVFASGNGHRYVAQSFNFVANSATTTLRFQDVSPTTANLDLLLDNVKIISSRPTPPPTPTPTPPPTPIPTPVPITTQTLAAVEALSAINFTSGERTLMLQLLSTGVPGLADGGMLSTQGWRDIRSISLINADQPALVFDPKPVGFVVNRSQEAIEWSSPAAVTVPTNREELAFYSIRDLAELIRTQQITATELTQLYLDRIRRHDPTLLAVITVTETLALQKAQQMDQEIAAGNYRGLLHGIPYGLKDIFAVGGYPTTWGAEPYRDRVIDRDAAVYRKLDEAGAILIAKLATGELAYSDRWFGGQTRNPWDPSASSGGSSSGPASATAAGLVGFAIGTETNGSIVDPATRCRVTGLRSTYGRVSRGGLMSFSWSLDQVGPICRTVEDCAVVLDAIRGADPADRTAIDAAFNFQSGRGLTGLTVGYVEGTLDPADLNVLTSLGATTIPVTMPTYPTGAMLSILAIEAAAAFDDLTRTGGLNILTYQGPYDLPNMIRTARTVSAVDYLQADRVRMKLIAEMAQLFESVDLLVVPHALDSNLAAANLIGLPCVLVPHGNGTGLLFVGHLYEEARLLEAAKAYQDATPYLEHPPLFTD